MPRDIPVGNGDLLINFDEQYRVRDIYYPCVGRYNHTGGHVQRFGVWADGEFSWVDNGWKREMRYLPDTLVTEVVLTSEKLGLELVCNDAVDFHEPVYFRRIRVRDRRGLGVGMKDGDGPRPPRDVRVFYHIDLSIKESPVGDTCDYDPETAGLVLYKDDSYFLVNARSTDRDDGEAQPAVERRAQAREKIGIHHWAIGTKRVGGAEGTWRDAEDGVLGKNAISQGSVDATVGVNLSVPAGGEASCTIWMACGDSYERVRELNRVIRNKGVDKMIARTEAYWRLWGRKDIDSTILPAKVRELFVRSQLILRTQVDNRGAIIAATDSDISHFAGDHYAYCWPRDGALVAYALVKTGQSELSRNFFRYCARMITQNGYFMHKYTPLGHLASSWHPWVINGKSVLPIQQDETALVLWSLRQHFETYRDVEFVKPLYNALVAQPATWLMEFTDENGLPRASWDLWEERRGIHTFTVAATIGALNAAAAFARDFGDVERAEALQGASERMREAMEKHLWNSQQSRFCRMATPIEEEGKSGGAEGVKGEGGKTEGNGKGGHRRVTGYRLDMTRDSANYALFAFGALRAGNPMVVSEMKSLWDRLWCKSGIGGCARYERDYYHQVERDKTDDVPGNPWVICTLWHAQHRIAIAKTPDELRGALPLLEWAADRAKKSGVLAEQYHPYTGEMVSVSPLTWSHAVVVTTVMEYLEKHAKLIAEANAVEGWEEMGVA
jgi:GH15 family glucan-1,4-alpha-glucosidase